MSDNQGGVDILKAGMNPACFVGHPFVLDYERASILTSDAWKHRAKGLPKGCFLLAFYKNDNDSDIEEALLLRVIELTKLPTDNDVISSMIEHYKDDANSPANKLDEFTRHEFSFSGLDCRILGSFYRAEVDHKLKIEFGADIENFYSATNYKIYKPTGEVLKYIVNQSANLDQAHAIKIGDIRYSSARRFQLENAAVNVNITPSDFIGKRTALFGMTRTGKSNTIKKIIESTSSMSQKAPLGLQDPSIELQPAFNDAGHPSFKIGQIIFDINGEYANENLQDEGTAIYKLYDEGEVIRYSLEKKPGFLEMKVNFYEELQAGFEWVKQEMAAESADYVKSFMTTDFTPPRRDDRSKMVTYGRLVAAYRCCLHRAGFAAPEKLKTIIFTGNEEVNQACAQNEDDPQSAQYIKPDTGISLDDAVTWFIKYAEIKKKDLENKQDLKSMLIFLTCESNNRPVSGYIKIRKPEIRRYHTDTSLGQGFDIQINSYLREGKLVIIDLSEGNPTVQENFSQKICRTVFQQSLNNFTTRSNNNFIQFYFEEAHNLFPQADSKDLTDIYNRLAKEGAKLHLGLIYATQEVSSLSRNILKNTQNWFIAHLNNEDELKELKKYYDFADFTSSLMRFSPESDKGFVRMKTYSNPFVVPVQIDRFSVKDNNSA